MATSAHHNICLKNTKFVVERKNLSHGKKLFQMQMNPKTYFPCVWKKSLYEKHGWCVKKKIGVHPPVEKAIKLLRLT
jgi:hypothetical protein